MSNYKVKLHKIKAFAFDVDGVLTNGDIICLPENGDLLRTFDSKDGLGMRIAYMCGYHLAIITGGRSQSIYKRFYPVLAHEVIMDAQDKLPVFEDYCKRNNFAPEEVVYVGDDLPDIPVLQKCGLAVCPADAVEEVKAVSDYISHRPGGKGCVRDIIEQVLKVQGKWNLNPALYQAWRHNIDEEFHKMYGKK